MKIRRFLGVVLAGAVAVTALRGQPAGTGAQRPADPPARRSQWNGYERIDFYWAGRPCVLVLPQQAADGKPWVWRMGAIEAQAPLEVALLARGWAVAQMEVGEQFGAPRGTAAFNELYAHVVIHAGLARRVVVAGAGSGALAAVNFAATHPTRVAGLVLEQPVVDLRSWPGNEPRLRAQMLEAYGLTEEKFAGFKGNPVERVGLIAAAKLPIALVRSGGVELAPWEQNGGALERRQREAGAPVEVFTMPVNPTAVAEWVVSNARK